MINDIEKCRLILILLLVLTQSSYAIALDNNQTNPSKGKQSNQKSNQIRFYPYVPLLLNYKTTPRFFSGVKLDLEGKWQGDNLKDSKRGDMALLGSKLSITTFCPRLNLDVSRGLMPPHCPLSAESLGQDYYEKAKIQLRAFYLLLKKNPLIPWTKLRFGRQILKDDRGWLYNKSLDAFRLAFNKKKFALEFSIGTNLIDPKNQKDEMINYILHSTYWLGRKDRISFYSIVRRGRNGENHKPKFLGFSWRDRSIKNQKFWLNLASIMEYGWFKKPGGFGLDLGWISRFGYRLKPSLTLGFACGSKNFQQTGLQDNRGVFNGNTRFKYYGELFDPELSNILIWTVGLGISPLKKTSLDIVYHYYSQFKGSDKLLGVKSFHNPSGKDLDLGHEIDLILGTRISKNLVMAFSTGVFVPGKAFADEDSAFFGGLKLQFVF